MPIEIRLSSAMRYAPQMVLSARPVVPPLRMESLFEAASPRPTQLTARSERRHFEVEVNPKSEKHVQLLRGCVGYEGGVEHGKVHVNLHCGFWPWLKEQPYAIIEQCYVDALWLSGEHCPSQTDYLTLTREANPKKEWERNAVTCAQAIRENAISQLKELDTCGAGKLLLSVGFVSKSRREEYEAVTDNGNLRRDYEVFCDGKRFREAMIKTCDLAFPEQRQLAVQQIATQKNCDMRTTVFAMKRLERLHERWLDERRCF